MTAPDRTGVNVPVLLVAFIMTALALAPLVALVVIGLSGGLS